MVIWMGRTGSDHQPDNRTAFARVPVIVSRRIEEAHTAARFMRLADGRAVL